jgi:hypothetical protein
VADLYYAPVPACPDHGGPMRYDFAMCRWACRGWDGEGCAYTVTDEKLEWLRLGTTAGPPAWEPE